MQPHFTHLFNSIIIIVITMHFHLLYNPFWVLFYPISFNPPTTINFVIIIITTKLERKVFPTMNFTVVKL